MQQRSESGSVNGAVSERYTDRLWTILAGRYGHKLTSAFGDTPPPEWYQNLEGLTPEQWKRGIEKLNDSTEAWPPSAPEFKGWCLGDTQGWEHSRIEAANRDKVLALPEKTSDEIRAAGIAMMKEALI